MNDKIRSNGTGLFIVLPDVLVSSRDPHGMLPSVCYRRSYGLLARVSESNEWERLVCESVRLFSSKEGEGNLNEDGECLDSVTVSESLVESVERFVEVMDGVTNGAFLRGEENVLCEKWVELEWLKSRGYYGMEAFVVNRLEVALRLSWLHCNNGKKRGVKLKEKVNLAGVASNVFWRKKGCVDWWGKLDGVTKRKVFQAVLGKAAKSLVLELVLLCLNL